MVNAVNSGEHPDWANLDNYPFVNKVFGDARFTLQLLMANGDRVVGSGTLYGTYAGVVRSAAVNEAIVANGNVLENVPFTGINVFTNGLSTRTRGINVAVDFKTPLGPLSRVDWSLLANYTKTKVTRIRATPAPLAGSGQSLFDPVAISTLESATPRFKAILSGVYSAGRWTISGKERFFGNAWNYEDPGDGHFYRDSTGSAFITDVDVAYAVTSSISLAIGADNLFNKRPTRSAPQHSLSLERSAPRRSKSTPSSTPGASTAAIITQGAAQLRLTPSGCFKARLAKVSM